MKRIHLVEFEDLPWFPSWLRVRMTRMIIVMHKLLGTPAIMADLVARVMAETKQTAIVDLCSGSGGPMPTVMDALQQREELKNATLTLTDLYPDASAAEKYNAQGGNISYRTEPLDATKAGDELPGLRTMVGSFHHMRPEQARQILATAHSSRQPICIFELSDNAFPTAVWWAPLPINFLMSFFVTPLARPMTWQQLVFTYIIPIIPLFFAWDGTASNARTYTLEDMDELLEGLQTDDYTWEKNVIKGKAKHLYLIGKPV